MLPWVALYAISGWLFNHPQFGADERPGTSFDADEAFPEAMAAVPDPDTAADAIVAGLGQAAPSADIARTDALPPRIERGLSAVAKTAEGDQQLFVDMVRRTGSLRPVEDEAPEHPDALGELGPLAPSGVEPAAFERLATEALTELGVAAESVELRSAPRVRFSVDVDGEHWLATYDAKSGEVTFDPAPPDGPPIKRLLAKLHMTHVYPGPFGAAWLHTLVVDLVATAMLLWVVTGLLMWWQMRRLRRVGAVVMTSSLVATLWLLGAVVPRLLH